MSETRPATDPNGAFSQAGRSIAIDTPLGPDALLLTSVQGEDAISRPFVYTVEFLTMAGDSAVRGLIGKRVTLWLQNNHESWRRPVNGYVRRITGQPTSLRGYGGYRAEVVPRLWFLDCTADCRIFQTMTYPAIIKSLLDENGVTGCDFKLLKTDYPTVDYCVQYRESALAFISRLMEHVGIFFFHEHSAADHKLVITDANSFTKFTTPRQLRTAVGAETGDIQKVWSDTIFKPGAWVLTDYDFEAPSKLMKKQVKTTLSVALMPQHEWFDFPGGYTNQDVGTWLTRVRMEAEEAHHDRLLGLASVSAMTPGFRFDLVHTGSVNGGPARDPADKGDNPPDQRTDDHSASQQSGEPASYLITEVRHRVQERSYFHETSAEYSCEFVAIPAATPFRPERATPKSVVRGSQTATVVSPSSGDPIYTDEYGRVKVHFHWDRRGKRATGATSCWVRVAQNSAGAGFGGIAIPHAGQEVVVDFLEGDPDRPLIVGRVHNAEKIAPLELPLDKHKTITRDHGGNKIVMDGEAGQQNMTFISPRTLNFIAVADTAKPLSAAVPFDKVTAIPTTGGKPGLEDLKAINKNVADPGGSGTATNQSMYSIAEFCSNSIIGQNSNSYVLMTSTSWVGADSYSTVKGASWSWVDGDSHSTVKSCAYYDAYGVSIQNFYSASSTYNHASSYTRTLGFNRSITLGFATTYVGGTNSSIVAGANSSVSLVSLNNVIVAIQTTITKSNNYTIGAAVDKKMVPEIKRIGNKISSTCTTLKHTAAASYDIKAAALKAKATSIEHTAAAGYKVVATSLSHKATSVSTKASGIIKKVASMIKLN